MVVSVNIRAPYISGTNWNIKISWKLKECFLAQQLICNAQSASFLRVCLAPFLVLSGVCCVFWALHVCPLPRDPILHLDRCVLSHFHRLVALFKTAAMSWTAEMVCRLSSGLMRAELDVALRGDILKSSYNDEFGTRMQTC